MLNIVVERLISSCAEFLALSSDAVVQILHLQ